MSVIGVACPWTIEENADVSQTWTYYPNGTTAAPFDFTGWSASLMIRINTADVSPVMTLTVTLGATAGTVAFGVTKAQANSLVSLLPNQIGRYDVGLTSPGGLASYFIPDSPFAIARRNTR